MTDHLEIALLQSWREHRVEGRKRGIDQRHEWQVAPEWAHREADEWVRQDEAWHLLIGSCMALRAVEALERGDKTND